MDFGKPEVFCAVLLVSRDPRRLADLYRDVLGFPFEYEKHYEAETYYGCEVGDLPFAIHPMENFKGREPGWRQWTSEISRGGYKQTLHQSAAAEEEGIQFATSSLAF